MKLFMTLIMLTILVTGCGKTAANKGKIDVTTNQDSIVENNNAVIVKSAKSIKDQLQANFDNHNYWSTADFFWDSFIGIPYNKKYGKPDVDNFNDECVRLHGSLTVYTDGNTQQLFTDGSVHMCHVPVRFVLTDAAKSVHISYGYLVHGYFDAADTRENIKKAYMKPDWLDHPLTNGQNAKLLMSRTIQEAKITSPDDNDLENSDLTILQ